MKKAKKMLPVDVVLKAIEDEPEFPGEMPEQMTEMFLAAMEAKDLEFMVEAMRLSVRLSKQGIAERITAISNKG